MCMVYMVANSGMRASSWKQLIGHHKVERESVCSARLGNSWVRIVGFSDWHGKFEEVMSGCGTRFGGVGRQVLDSCSSCSFECNLDLVESSFIWSCDVDFPRNRIECRICLSFLVVIDNNIHIRTAILRHPLEHRGNSARGRVDRCSRHFE